MFSECLGICILCCWCINQICWLEILFCYWIKININFIWRSRAILVSVPICKMFTSNTAISVWIYIFEKLTMHFLPLFSIFLALSPSTPLSLYPCIHLFIQSFTQQIVLGIYFILNVGIDMGSEESIRSERQYSSFKKFNWLWKREIKR